MDIDPNRTAVICVECQNGVLGESAVLPALAQSAVGLIAQLRPLLTSARSAGITVAHAVYTGSLGGSVHEPAPMWRTLGALSDTWTDRAPEAQVVPALYDESDLLLARHHGLNPARDTELLPVLRGRGVDTVVLAGVSLNVALILLTGEAIHQGFRVVIPRDVVIATPDTYGPLILDNSLRMLAHLTTSQALIDAWSS